MDKNVKFTASRQEPNTVNRSRTLVVSVLGGLVNGIIVGFILYLGLVQIMGGILGLAMQA